MMQQQLQEWIKHPERLDKNSLYELRTLLERYPYFQTAWVLYLKNLFLLNDPAFRDELRRGALFVADIGVLFYYLEGDRFRLEEHEPVSAVADGADRTLDLIDRFLSGHSDAAPAELPAPDMAAVDYTSVLMGESVLPAAEEATPPLRGQELIDHFIESADDERNVLPEDADAAEPEDEDTETEEKEPETDNEEDYFTETLAKIYVKQQRYDKALEIIKKLNLKYPKKNTYFADQMRFLEKLIINAKSK